MYTWMQHSVCEKDVGWLKTKQQSEREKRQSWPDRRGFIDESTGPRCFQLELWALDLPGTYCIIKTRHTICKQARATCDMQSLDFFQMLNKNFLMIWWSPELNLRTPALFQRFDWINLSLWFSNHPLHPLPTHFHSGEREVCFEAWGCIYTLHLNERWFIQLWVWLQTSYNRVGVGVGRVQFEKVPHVTAYLSEM